MPTPGERKTVQSRILACAVDIWLTTVARNEAEWWRGFEPQRQGFGKRAAIGSLWRAPFPARFLGGKKSPCPIVDADSLGR